MTISDLQNNTHKKNKDESLSTKMFTTLGDV